MTKPLVLACLTVLIANLVSFLLTSGSNETEQVIDVTEPLPTDVISNKPRPVAIYSEQRAYEACNNILDERYGSKLKLRHLNHLSSGLDQESGEFLVVVEGSLGLGIDAKPLRAYCYVNPRTYKVNLTAR